MAYETKRIPASKPPNRVEDGRIPKEDRQRVAGYKSGGWEVFMVTSAPDPEICLRRPEGWEPPSKATPEPEEAADDDPETGSVEEIATDDE